MASSQQQLSFAIRAVNEATKALKDVESDIKGIGSEAEKASKPAGKFSGALGDIGKTAAGVFAGGALLEGAKSLGGFLLDAAQGAAEDAAATARLEQALRNAGGAFDENVAKVNARIDAGAKMAFTDDQIRDSFQQLLGATGDVNESLDRQRLAMDLARGANISLEQASKMVSKVNEENVEAFKRLGISIGDGATEAEALAAVQAKFAGQADTYAQSTAGQFESAKIRLGEAKEAIGTALLPVLAKLVTVFADDVLPVIEDFSEKVGPKITEFMENVKKYWESDAKPALDTLKDVFEKLKPVIIPVMDEIQNRIELAVNVITGVLDILIKLLGGDFSGAWDSAKQLVSDVMGSMKESVENAFRVMKGLAGLAQEAGSALGGALLDGLKSAITAVGGFASDVGQAVLAAVKHVINTYVIGPINRGLEFKIPVPGAPDIHINPPDIPYLARGGVVTRPTLAVLGEAGPEAVVPLSGGAGRAASKAGWGGMNIVVNVQAIDAAGFRRVIPEIARELAQHTRRAYGVAV